MRATKVNNYNNNVKNKNRNEKYNWHDRYYYYCNNDKNYNIR